MQTVEDNRDFRTTSRPKGPPRRSAHVVEQEHDLNAWEVSQIIASGVAFPNKVSTDFDDESAERVEIQVIETKPPFLDPNIKYTEQKEPGHSEPYVEYGKR